MKKKFQSEANDHLDQFEKMLFVLEKEPQNLDAVDSAFRAIHGIKGNSDYIGISDINTLSHELEDLMDEMRSQSIPVVKPVLTLLFKGLDLLREMNQQITSPDYQEKNLSHIHNEISKIKTIAVDQSPDTKKTRRSIDIIGVFSQSAKQHLTQLDDIAAGILNNVPIKDDKIILIRIVKTFLTSANYVGMKDIASILTEIQKKSENINQLDQSFAKTLQLELSRIKEMISKIYPKSTPSKPVNAPPAPADIDTFSDLLTSEMKIDLAHVDRYMNQIAELGIFKNHLNYLSQSIPEEIKNHSWARSLHDISYKISKMTDNLKSSVMKLRLVKINTIYERFPRIVKNLCQNSDRLVSLSLEGKDIAMDRKIIEELIDPLIHIIRNAVDHGIEDKQERLKKKKEASGKISVVASQEGNHVMIEVTDDGKGLDPDIIKQNALKKGLIQESTLQHISDDEALNLIFLPGFSTTPKPTPVSGRGVGLDVVSHAMKHVGGSIAISSAKNQYTTFRLTLPISMIVKDVLLTEAGGDIYAFPLSSILETIQIDENIIQRINNKPAIAYKDNVLPIRYLGEILEASDLVENASCVNTSDSVKNNKIPRKEKLPVIVLMHGSQLSGIIVDRILDSEGVLSKPLSHHLAVIPEFSSAAVLGDGTIVLIINPAGIITNENG